MSQTALEEMQDQLSVAVETLNLDGGLSFKAMFGGVSGYMEGRVFASLSNRGLALKLSPGDQTALLQQGAQRLRYEPDAPESKQYIVVPGAMQTDAEALAVWVKRSAEYVAALPVPKPKPKKRP